jgi:hypothetical protein
VLNELHSQLLDLLLDVNNSAQIPGHLRIDLSLDVPSLDALPNLVSDADLEAIKSNTPHGQAVHNEIRTMMEAKMQDKLANKPTKSLASLMANTPYRPFTLPNIPYNISSIPGLRPLELQDLSEEHPVTYLPPSELDDYLSATDASLKLQPALAVNAANPSVHLSDKELAFRNPNSVYNWLRRHKPNIFLQDGEGSEKSLMGKPGALRGAGKRASIPAPSRPDAVEFVEEDGIGYDASLGGAGGAGAKGKRKRASDEDAGYRPKGGSSKPSKKKRKDGSGESAVGGKSAGSKAKGRNEMDLESSIIEMET